MFNSEQSPACVVHCRWHLFLFSEDEVALNGSLSDDEMLRRFSEAVRTIRIAAGISQNGLTTSAGLHRDYIWVLEKRGTNVSLDAVQRIAMSLDVSVADLFRKHLEE
jgi:DNA-binding XRE family transcriptional regulator